MNKYLLVIITCGIYDVMVVEAKTQDKAAIEFYKRNIRTHGFTNSTSKNWLTTVGSLTVEPHRIDVLKRYHQTPDNNAVYRSFLDIAEP